ncbi:MAG: conjugal transfer protein MobB [Rikenellaceae bacterium]
MVAKIESGHSLYGSLRYNFRKVENDVAKVLLTNKILHPSEGELTTEGCLRDMMNFIPSKVRSRNPVLHVSINPHPDDILSDNQLAEIAKEYLERMGYGDQPYLIYKHEDLSRHHLHIVSLRIREDGSKISDKFERRRSKDITRYMERRYGLHAAERGERIEVDKPHKVDTTKGVESQIRGVLRGVLGRYHYLSFNEYRALLSLYNVTVEEVKGTERGVNYNGYSYSATNDQGVKIGRPIDSSQLGKVAGYDAIQAHFVRSKNHLKRHGLASNTKSRVSDALRKSSSKGEFQRELQRRGIDVIFRENDAGRLYGVTYIDHTNMCVLNGSRLGRDLSANAITDWFENPQRPQIDAHLDQHLSQEFQSKQVHYEEDFSLGGLFDLPYDNGIDDPEEERFRRQMQRKKKKGRKL